jgi:hypothetical protein
MAIGDYLSYLNPTNYNVFGVENPAYTGLLGDQAAGLKRSSNIAGLLGAAAALAQGVSGQGARRSAAQNIINALGAGYGSAGQAYQQGLQNFGQTQQLAIQQRQQAGVQAMKMKYPDLADEFDTNPAGAFRIVAEREAAAKKPIVVEGNLVDPTGKVLFTANKPQARMLSAAEVLEQQLPTGAGQKYQVDANGKIDLIQGTAPIKRDTAVVNGQIVDVTTGNVIFGTPTGDKTSDIKNYEYYLSKVPVGQKAKTFDQYVESTTNKTIQNNYPAGAVPLGKEGANKVDTQLLDLGQNRLNLQSIAYNFKPDYLKDTFKLKIAAYTKAEKLGLPIDDATKAEIADYSKFTQDAYTNLNAYINLITGAAVGSGEEEARIRKGIPDPQKDSPTEFFTKLTAKMREGRLYEARLGYIKQNGMKMTDVDVNKIPTLMRQTEAKLKSDNRLFGNKPYDDKDPNHKAIVRALMSKEFGLME